MLWIKIKLKTNKMLCNSLININNRLKDQEQIYQVLKTHYLMLKNYYKNLLPYSKVEKQQHQWIIWFDQILKKIIN